MILSFLFSATLTFTATATGVEKGTAIEFILAGQNSDRAYESMFVLDEPVDSFCTRIEKAVPRGAPAAPSLGRLWPTGCRIRFEPSFEQFVSSDLPDRAKGSVAIFTGGTRRADGKLEASDEMPAAVFSTYALPQAPIVSNEPIDQGSAYGHFTAAQTLKKGDRFTFRMIIDENSMPKKIDLVAEKGNLKQVLEDLRTASCSGDVDATVTISDSLTVDEATSVAKALAVIDSSRVKINGARGLFYRAFLPLERWRDRQERLLQPFELTLKDDGTDELLFIGEDWTAEGDDPKLSPRTITYTQAVRYPKTDTCFIYASKTQSVMRLTKAMSKFGDKHIANWYVFKQD